MIQNLKNFVLGCLSISRFGLAFAMILIGQQARGFLISQFTMLVGNVALDGTFLGISLINLLGHLPMLGISSAIDMLGVQALSDHSTHKEVGVIVFRTVLVCILVSFPLISLLLLLKPVLLYIHQKGDIVDVAMRIIEMSIVIVPVNAITMCMTKYLFILKRQMIVFYVVIITIALFVGILVLSIFAAKQHTIEELHWMYFFSELLPPALFIIYFKVSKVHKSTWEGFTIKSLARWFNVLVTGLPNCGIIVLEWGMYEVFILIIGSKSPEVLKDNAIAFTIISISYLLLFGVGVSATTHISQSLSTGKLEDARKYAKNSIVSSLIVALLVVIGSATFKEAMEAAFSITDKSFDKIVPWVSFYIILDALQISLNSVLRGFNMHIVPMIITTVSFIVSLVTGSLILMLRPTLLVQSVWVGLCVGGAVACLGLTFYLTQSLNKINQDPSSVLFSSQPVEVDDSAILVEEFTDNGDTTFVNPNHIDVNTDNADSVQRLLPTTLNGNEVQHLLIEKGSLFVLGFIIVVVCAAVNLSKKAN